MVKAGRTADALRRLAEQMGVAFAVGRKSVPTQGPVNKPTPAPAKPQDQL